MPVHFFPAVLVGLLLLAEPRAWRVLFAWPTPHGDLLYYQGMFRYFAFDDEPPPDPMTAPCRTVHERYVAEPLSVAALATQGYSWRRYGTGPFRIGFCRLRAAR